MFRRACHLSPFLSQMNAVSTISSYFFEICVNIILPLVPRSSKWSLTCRFPHQNSCVHFSCSHMMCHILHMSLICLVTLIISVISTNHEASNTVFLSLLILPLRPTYLSQHPIFEHSQSLMIYWVCLINNTLSDHKKVFSSWSHSISSGKDGRLPGCCEPDAGEATESVGWRDCWEFRYRWIVSSVKQMCQPVSAWFCYVRWEITPGSLVSCARNFNASTKKWDTCTFIM